MSMIGVLEMRLREEKTLLIHLDGVLVALRLRVL
jgi:hypothetical protein